jgi:NAD(P)-dependent dehydrogenase (short-subunit alcohol dehydrogenase family)
VSDSRPTILITGGSSGIGRATGRIFAERGWQVILAARSEAALAKASAEFPGSSYQLVDVSDEHSVADLFERVGPVDVVVHAAAVMAYGRLEELDPAVFRTVTRTGIEGTFYVARAALQGFRRQHKGILVVLNSLVGQIASPQLGAYTTAKWAQAGLLRTLQLELRGESGIHVCTVTPGAVNTPIYRQAANITGRQPRPPLPVDQPEKVAEAILACVMNPRSRVDVGLANKFIRFGFHFCPALYDALVGPLLNRLSLLSEPVKDAAGNVFEASPEGEAETDRWLSRWSISSRR